MKSSKRDKSVEDEVLDGKRAAAILNDPVVNEAFDALETQWTWEWRNAKTAEDREMRWALIHSLEALKDALGVTKNNGEIATLKPRQFSIR